jgi:putative ABC transport system substrate-binding protein
LNRRAFIAVLGGAAAWPLAGRAQQPERMRRLGVLSAWAEKDPTVQEFMTTFAQAIGRFGWTEGKNIRTDWRFAAGDPTLFTPYAAELVGLSPDAIFANTTPAVMALRKQTRTIPIVFTHVPDAVGLGIVQSLARPGGNMTGFSILDAPLMGKWLQLLKQFAPTVTRVAVIFNPETAPHAQLLNQAIEAAAQYLGITVMMAPVHDDAAIEEAIASMARAPRGGLVIPPDPFAYSHRSVTIAAAAYYGLPSIGAGQQFPRDGGLMTYQEDPLELAVQGASYIDRILKGASPADLPVQQPTKYSLIINLKTAKALGLAVPQNLLLLADEVIE